MSTSPAGGRRGRKQSPSLTGRTRLHPVHVDHREKKGRVDAVHRKETRSTVDQRLRPPWTMPVNQAKWRPTATTWQHHSLPRV